MTIEQLKEKYPECFGETIVLDTDITGKVLILDHDPFLIAYGDNIYSCNIEKIIVNGVKRPLISVMAFDQSGYTIKDSVNIRVEYDLRDSIVKLYEKFKKIK